MKNILVPTDFSACAAFAVNTALRMAQYYGATLHLYTRLDVRRNWQQLSEEDRNDFPEEKQTIHNAEVLFGEWEEKTKGMGLSFVSSWSAGDLPKNIQRYVGQHAIDMVVMGSYGASGKNEYFIGSNTQKVVRVVHVPMLIVKQELTEYTFQKVVFASNFDLSEKPVFKYLLDFVRPFKPEIHLLAINTSGWFGQPYSLVKSAMDDFKVMCTDLPYKLHFFKDWTVDAGIRHLSEKIGADLIAISNRQRHPLRRIFSGSNVEALVNHADIPVLSIDFKTDQ